MLFMKRICALLLAFSLLFSALFVFSACDSGKPIPPEHVHSFENETLVLPATDTAGVKQISTCSGCGETKEIFLPFSETTKEAWQKMLRPVNYSVSISYAGNEGSYTVTENGYLMTDSMYGFEQYYVEEEDGWYSVALVDGEYRSHRLQIIPDLSIGSLIIPGMEDAFDGFENAAWTFAYSEEWHAYVHTRETNKYFFFIADDTLVKIIGFAGENLDAVTPESAPSEDYAIFIFDFHSYGTTELVVPDYK